jgi:arsenate reductase
MLRDDRGCDRGATGEQTRGLLQLESRGFVADRLYTVLFLCTGNSARSIMAEAILNQVGAGRFRAFSAGSHPTGAVNPFALELLRASRIPVDGLRSKGWDEFAKADTPGAGPSQAGQPPSAGPRESASGGVPPGAGPSQAGPPPSGGWRESASGGVLPPTLDFVFTVCDNAAGEMCPVWPGQPVTAHWGVPDPAAVTGSDDEKRHAFSEACRLLVNRIRIFTSLPLAKLDDLALKKRLDDIGKER